MFSPRREVLSCEQANELVHQKGAFYPLSTEATPTLTNQSTTQSTELREDDPIKFEFYTVVAVKNAGDMILKSNLYFCNDEVAPKAYNASKQTAHLVYANSRLTNKGS